MRITGEIVNLRERRRRSNAVAVDQVGHTATSTQKWVTPIVLYFRRAHLGYKANTDLPEELPKKRRRTEVFVSSIGSQRAHRQAQF